MFVFLPLRVIQFYVHANNKMIFVDAFQIKFGKRTRREQILWIVYSSERNISMCWQWLLMNKRKQSLVKTSHIPKTPIMSLSLSPLTLLIKIKFNLIFLKQFHIDNMKFLITSSHFGPLNIVIQSNNDITIRIIGKTNIFMLT